MTIQQLKYILEVNRAGSISAAAGNLFIAQPNLSNAIRALENELGFPIFVRTGKGVRPTERGIAVLGNASQIMDSLAKMQNAGSQAQENRLRIAGLQYSPVCDVYVQLCTEYQDAADLDFSYCTDLMPEQMIEQVYLSLVDIGVFMIHPQHISTIEHLCRQRGLYLTEPYDIPIVLRIGPKHPMYKQAEIRLDEFYNYTFVDYNNRLSTDFPHLVTILSIRPDRVVYVSDHTLKNQLVSKSTMYTLGSKLTAECDRQYRFRSIPLGDAHYTLYAVMRREQKSSQTAKRFLSILAEKLEEF